MPAHQFADGSVYHWWHPLSEQGLVTKMTDDLLWLGFVTANYLKETGDFSILADAAPFLDDPVPAPLEEHVRRAFERVFARTSSRGLPFIGAGDWNDGLSAAGLQEKGESVWLGHFLAGLLGDWSEIYKRSGRAGFARDYDERRDRLVRDLNEHGWDGEWYWRATLDDGSRIGSRENTHGRIFLNAQTWAVLNDVAPPDRAESCMRAVREHLVRDSGSLLLAPAYDTPDERIGYITRYAPGLRENGGVYTHAATWAIAAAAKMKDADLVGRLLHAIDPDQQRPRALLGRALRPPRQRRRPRLAVERAGRVDLVHRLRVVAPPRRRRMGIRRAANVGGVARRSVPAPAMGACAGRAAVAGEDAGDRNHARDEATAHPMKR